MDIGSFNIFVSSDADEKNTAVCYKYWKLSSKNKWSHKLGQLAKEYGYKSHHELSKIVQKYSYLESKNSCTAEECNNHYRVYTRSEAQKIQSPTYVLSHFPDLLNFDQYTNISNNEINYFLENFDYYCTKHSKTVLNKIKVHAAKIHIEEWISIIVKLNPLIIQLNGDNILIEDYEYDSNTHLEKIDPILYSEVVKKAKNNDEILALKSIANYFSLFQVGNDFHNFTRKKTWNFFCDYWARKNNNWLFSEAGLVHKYRIDLYEIPDILSHGNYAMPRIVYEFTAEAITNREEYEAMHK